MLHLFTSAVILAGFIGLIWMIVDMLFGEEY